MIFSAQSDGFTLVELAIGMIVIGLLVGGIIKGQEVIRLASLKSTYATAKSYTTSKLSFTDAYGGVPGDMSNPGIKLTGCTTLPTCVTTGGNDNGIIGQADVPNWSVNDQSAVNTEPTQFWIQLLAARMVSGLSGENNDSWGGLYPASPKGGGFHVVHTLETGNNRAQGHYLVLKTPIHGSATPVNNDAVLTPGDMAYLERKFDDSEPGTGDIISDDNHERCWNLASRDFLETSSLKTCLAAFRLQ
mgnify:CR=1 FL=1